LTASYGALELAHKEILEGNTFLVYKLSAGITIKGKYLPPIFSAKIFPEYKYLIGLNFDGHIHYFYMGGE
jgi:hypothetical protein